MELFRKKKDPTSGKTSVLEEKFVKKTFIGKWVMGNLSTYGKMPG